MERLLTLDSKNYTDEMPVYERFAVRAIIVKDGKLATQKSSKNYYKILGGGIDKGETHEMALAREVQEEAGLVVKPDSIKLIGEVYEAREDLYKKGMKYISHSYFYQCDVEDKMVDTALTASEVAENFTLCWATLDEIIAANDKCKGKVWVTRDTDVIKLIKEGKVEITK